MDPAVELRCTGLIISVPPTHALGRTDNFWCQKNGTVDTAKSHHKSACEMLQY